MRRAEDNLQRAIVDYLRAVAPQCLVFAIPNGGFRTAAEAGILQATGVVKGIPDLGLLLPGGAIRFIEIKTAEGALSKAQRAIFDRFLSMGQPYAVCRSIENVRVALQHWNVETREAKP